MSRKLTFEFPDARSAVRFEERVADDDLGVTRLSHRTVDVLVHESATEDAAHDAIVLAARFFGASVPEPAKDEPIGSFEFDLTSAAVGPRVKVWGEVDAGEVDAACPDGWEVDWNTSPSPLSTTRDGKRGFAHPLCSKDEA